MSSREWAEKLAILVAPDRVDDATETLSQIGRMLDDLPSRCFKSRSALAAVANAKRRTVIPTLANIRAALLQWLKENPDTSPAGDGTPASWNIGERSWHDYWLKREAEGFCDIGNPIQDRRGNLLDLLLHHAPRVHAWIVGADGAEIPYAASRADVERIMHKWRTGERV